MPLTPVAPFAYLAAFPSAVTMSGLCMSFANRAKSWICSTASWASRARVPLSSLAAMASYVDCLADCADQHPDESMRSGQHQYAVSRAALDQRSPHMAWHPSGPRTLPHFLRMSQSWELEDAWSTVLR